MKTITKSLLVGSITMLGSVGGVPAAYALCQGVAETNNCLAVPATPAPSCRGTAGEDVLVCLSSPCVASGLHGQDIIVGADGSDRLCGDGGTDLIRGNGGNDALSGGRGRDAVGGDEGNDVSLGQQGNDVAVGSDGNDLNHGGEGNKDVCVEGETNVDCEFEL